MTSIDSARTLGPGSDDESDDSSDPVDPDFLLLARYGGGDMTVKEQRDFLRRLKTDPELGRKLGPLAALYAITLPYDEQAATDAFGKRVLRRATRQEEKRRQQEQKRQEHSRRTAGKRSTTGEPVWASKGGGAWKWVAWIVGTPVAMVVLLVTVIILNHGKIPVWILKRMISKQTIASLQASAAYMKQGKNLVLGRGPLVQDTTGPGETIETYGIASDHVVIRPSSRYAYRTSLTALDYTQMALGPHATVDGEVLLDMAGPINIDSRMGFIQLEPGIYVIRCLPRANELLITVGSGEASVLPMGAHGAKPTLAHRGEYLRLPLAGTISVTEDSTGFPRLDGDVAVRKVPRGIPDSSGGSTSSGVGVRGTKATPVVPVGGHS